jgi:hypothetical protein
MKKVSQKVVTSKYSYKHIITLTNNRKIMSATKIWWTNLILLHSSKAVYTNGVCTTSDEDDKHKIFVR